MSEPEPVADIPADEPATAAPVAAPRRRWLAVGLLVVLVAIVSAVLVVALDLVPGGPPRLSDQEQAQLESRLTGIDAGLDRLVEQGALLAEAGRDVLTAARALDPDGVDAAIAVGSQASAAISGQREDIIKRRETLTVGLDASRIGDAERTRIGTIDRALIGATQLPVSWISIVSAVSGPADLVRSIQGHDARVAEATVAARADDLPGALTALAEAQRLLVPARAVRRIADEAGADVSTLDDLLARLDAYDLALTRLYTLLQASGGSVTDEIRTAYEEVGAAQASLPLDQDALSIVVSDLAGQAITAALVDIESQRGLLTAAVAARPDADGR